jgi:hypothetical protein
MIYNSPTMSLQIKPIAVLIGILSITLTGCDDNKSERKNNNNYVLNEVIDVEGKCWENHVGQKDTYSGQIVRWQTVKTGKTLTYGFLSLPFSAERILSEAKEPTTYHVPSIMEFDLIDIDTNLPHWVIHGVSSRGENTQGYDSTCEVDVKKRGTNPADIRAPGEQKSP